MGCEIYGDRSQSGDDCSAEMSVAPDGDSDWIVHNNIVIFASPSPVPTGALILSCNLVISDGGCSDQALIWSLITLPGALSRNWAIKRYICLKYSVKLDWQSKLKQRKLFQLHQRDNLTLNAIFSASHPFYCLLTTLSGVQLMVSKMSSVNKMVLHWNFRQTSLGQRCLK